MSMEQFKRLMEILCYGFSVAQLGGPLPRGTADLAIKLSLPDEEYAYFQSGLNEQHGQ